MEALINSRTVILFDLDGTLIDSNGSVRDSLYSSLHCNGYQLPERDIYKQLFGLSEHDVLMKLGIPEDKIPDLLDDWTRSTLEYSGNIPYYDGIPELIQTLRQQGCVLGVVTGRMRKTTRIIPITLELEELMDLFVNPEDTVKGKPDPEPVNFAIDQLGVTPDRAIFIGDSANDITAAFLAGCTSILVAWGVVKDAAGFPVKPDYTVSIVDELKQLLAG
jgi:pyrophosphatase PpaX